MTPSGNSVTKAPKAPLEIGVYSETAPLRIAALYGKPGPEAVFGQLLPKSISLFLDRMDVDKAGSEMDNLAALLRDHGVSVILIKSELAEQLPDSGMTRNTALAALLHKARFLKKVPGSRMPSEGELRETLARILDRDIQELGEKGAIALAKATVLDPPLPLANIAYARDQTNVALDRRIISSMAYGIREQEVQLFESVYRKLSHSRPIEMPVGESFEGGDLYVHDRTVFVGVGARTTPEAAMHVFRELGKQKDIRYAMVQRPVDNVSFAELQASMHLDTFSMPTGDKQIAVCHEEAEKREVTMVRVGDDGFAERVTTGKTFSAYLKSEGYEILDVSPEEQKAFGCNFLVLGPHDLVMPVSSNVGIIKQLEERGKKVMHSDMQQLANGFGAAHCVTSSLLRKE